MKSFFLILTLIFFSSVKGLSQVYHENFEIPDSVSYTSNGSAGWSQNSRIPLSGLYCDSAVFSNPGDIFTMTTIPFSTVGMNQVYLYFHHIAKIEFFDLAYVEASINGGVSWNRLISDIGNPSGTNNCQYMGNSNFGTQSSSFSEASYVAWMPGLPSVVPSMDWWKREIFDLSALLSNISDVRIRFVLVDYNSSGAAGRLGWYIDDVWVSNILDSNLTVFPNKITGKVYLDLNSNSQQDTLEPGISNQMIELGNTLFCGFSQTSGNYTINSNVLGSYNVVLNLDSLYSTYFNLMPVSYPLTINFLGQTDSLIDFALQPTVIGQNLCASIVPLTLIRSGLMATYRLEYRNLGPTLASNTSIVFYPDASVDFISANITPSAIYNDSVIWNTADLNPFQAGFINVNVLVDMSLPIGATIVSGVKIEPVAGDLNPVCNIHFRESQVTGSYDPNDILVDIDTILSTTLPNTPFLEYLIRFQNTGNDTAFIVNIHNYISDMLEFGTFQMLSSSHNVVLDYNPLNRLMKFRFDNILLPDSNINEPESHGFVRYRIKPVTILQVGDSIPNQAHIYFDFNDPVSTNTAITEVVDPTFIFESNSIITELELMPNPVKDALYLEFYSEQNENISIFVYNVSGNVIAEKSFQVVSGNQKAEIDCSGLPAGVYLIKKVSGSAIAIKRFVKI